MNPIISAVFESLLNDFSDINLVHQVFPSSIIGKIFNQLMGCRFDVHTYIVAATLSLFKLPANTREAVTRSNVFHCLAHIIHHSVWQHLKPLERIVLIWLE